MKVVMVLSVEAFLIGALIAAVFTCSLCRRSTFGLRFSGLVIAIVLPGLVAAIVAPLGEHARGMLFFLGLGWGLLLLAASRPVLFHRQGPDPGPDHGDGGGGPRPGDGRRTPPAPTGGIPLPDAEPSLTRVRNHRPPRRAGRLRRPVHARERLPSRLWPLRLRPSGRFV